MYKSTVCLSSYFLIGVDFRAPDESPKVNLNVTFPILDRLKFKCWYKFRLVRTRAQPASPGSDASSRPDLLNNPVHHCETEGRN